MSSPKRHVFIALLFILKKEIVKQDKSLFCKSFAGIFKGVICLTFGDSFVHYYNEKAKLIGKNDSKLNIFFSLKSEEIGNTKKSVKLYWRRALSKAPAERSTSTITGSRNTITSNHRMDLSKETSNSKQCSLQDVYKVLKHLYVYFV